MPVTSRVTIPTHCNAETKKIKGEREEARALLRIRQPTIRQTTIRQGHIPKTSNHQGLIRQTFNPQVLEQ